MRRISLLLLLIATSIQAATPVEITDPLSEQDALAEAAPTPSGFIVAWNRGEATGPMTVLAQQFDAQRQPVQTPIELQVKAIGTVGRPELLPLNAKTVAAFWVGGDKVRGGLIKLSQNKITGIKDIDKPGDLIHDAALMSNGNIAMVMVKEDISNPFDLREKVSFLILSPTLNTLKKTTSVHGQGFPLDGWNTFDHTIVALNNGALVLFRDRDDGNLLARSFDGSGKLRGAVYRINTTPMPLGSVTDFVMFNVKAVRLKNGAVAVVWTSMEGESIDKWEIRARLLDASGKPLGKDFRVNAATAGSQLSPDVLALPNGGFCVTWVSTVGFERLYLYRSYRADGAPLFKPRISEQVPLYLQLPLDTESVLLGNGAMVTVMDGFGFPGPLRADLVPQVAK